MHQCLHILKEADPRPRLTEEILTGEEAGEEGLVCGGRIQVSWRFFETDRPGEIRGGE